LRLTIDDLLTILDAAALLGFVEVSEGIVTVTEDGRRFATADILRSKELFRQQALTHAPLVTAIYQTLREKRDGSMRSDYFLDNLDGYFPAEEAEKQLATATDWGRYAELFEYDVNEGRLTLTMDE
jgi:NitT/TauT family transport system ATP-binding protein